MRLVCLILQPLVFPDHSLGTKVKTPQGAIQPIIWVDCGVFKFPITLSSIFHNCTCFGVIFVLIQFRFIYLCSSLADFHWPPYLTLASGWKNYLAMRMRHSSKTDCILHGFKLALADCTFLLAQQNNYKPATSAAHKAKNEQTIWGEIAYGNYVITDIKPTIISALGAIPKPDSSGVQLIHDCSQPLRQALNGYIQLFFV